MQLSRNGWLYGLCDCILSTSGFEPAQVWKKQARVAPWLRDPERELKVIGSSD